MKGQMRDKDGSRAALNIKTVWLGLEMGDLLCMASGVWGLNIEVASV